MIAEAKLMREIEKHLDELVRRAEKCIEEYIAEVQRKNLEKSQHGKEESKEKSEEKLSESQLRNLQNLASATDSVPVLKNFIGYQMGRNSIPAKVGNRILEDIQELERKAEELTQRHPELLRQARMELVRLYLGFLVREFVAKKHLVNGKD